MALVQTFSPGSSRFLLSGAAAILENLSKHDGDGWRERHKTKGLISKTMTLHVGYRFLYISLPSSANNNVKWPNSQSYVELSEL